MTAATDEPILLPFLKEYDWKTKDRAVFEHYLGHDKAPIPLIAYGYVTADDDAFISRDEQGDRSIEDIRAEAMYNLAREPGLWRQLKPGILSGSGWPFSAEKLLDADFLIAAQRQLETDRILVSVPRRGMIYCLDLNASRHQSHAFTAAVVHTLRDDSSGQPRVSPLLFEFTDGENTGMRLLSLKEET